MRRLLAASAVIGLTLAASPALAGTSFVTLTDDGTIEGFHFQTATDWSAMEKKLLDLYAATGSETPDILSVWTTFPLDGDVNSTYFDPQAFDVHGIGLEQYFGNADIPSPHPPLRSILFHNDVVVLDQRAANVGAPSKDFGRYLFLLEMTHNWGPELELPSPNQQELVGFPFHWSFWMDAGGSPAGGNQWQDNGDGTFTALPLDASTVAYSRMDLYLMGLATAAEVPAFGVLENVTPNGIQDPAWGGDYAAHSFPWMTTNETFTVSATRRTVTIDDVIAANGMRMPAAGSGPSSYKLGIVLVVSKNDGPSAVTSAEATFDPIASGFAPAFHEATMQRATLDVVTPPPPSTTGSGGAGGASAASTSVTVASSSSTAAVGSGGGGGVDMSTSAAGGDEDGSGKSSGCGCEVETRSSSWGLIAFGAAMLALASRRRRA